LSPVAETTSEQFPIDLPTALQLAGANNLQIALARQRVCEAIAKRNGAEAQWIPSLVAGAVYSHHDGRVQNTDGTMIDVERNARFVGGGPNLGAFPLTGPGGPPARLALGLPLADVLYAPLAERQMVSAAQAASVATLNDTLLQVAVAYFDVVRAQGQLTIADQAILNATELERLVVSRVKAGTAPPADELRANVELAERQRQRMAAQQSLQVASAELAQLLRLDPSTTLYAMEDANSRIDLVDMDQPLEELIAQGMATRPELAQYRAVAQATIERYQQERKRPWLPTAQVGFSAGGMGGGVGTSSDGLEGRTDFDAALVWELRNLGFGNRALQQERWSRQRQAEITVEQLVDSISAQIVTAYYQAMSARDQLESARAQVEAAAEAVPLNFKGVLGGDLRAIEAQQSIQDLALAQDRYLNSIVELNQAQCQLLRSIGTTPMK
jgi:outer membrane protein TolC